MPRRDVRPGDRAQIRHAALVAAADVEQCRGIAHHVEARDRVPAQVHRPGLPVEAQSMGVDPDTNRREPQTVVGRLLQRCQIGVRVGGIAAEPIGPHVLAPAEVRVLALLRVGVEVLQRALEARRIDPELFRQLPG